MTAALLAYYFRTHHSMASVFMHFNSTFFSIIKTRPASSGIKLDIRLKQLVATRLAKIPSLALFSCISRKIGNTFTIVTIGGESESGTQKKILGFASE